MTTLTIEPTYLRLRTPEDVRLAPDGARLAFVEGRIDAAADRRTTTIRLLAERGERWEETHALPGALPRWSPDGARLAFVAPGDGGIQLLDVASGATRPLAAVSGVRDLAWRADSAMLAFAAPLPQEDDGRPRPLVFREADLRLEGEQPPIRPAQLHALDPTSGAVRLLARTAGSVGSLCWHPREDRLAFAAGLHPHAPSHAYVVDGDGEGLARATPELGECEAVAWTAAGDALVVAGKQLAAAVGQRRLWLADPATRTLRELAADLDLEVDVEILGWHGSAPVVEPDGAGVLFTACEGTTVVLFRARLDGGPTERLLGDDEEAVGRLSVAGGRVATLLADGASTGEVAVAEQRAGPYRRVTNLNAGVFDGFPRLERRSFHAPDGTRVDGLLLRPPEQRTPGPLLLSIHGGPHGVFCAPLWEMQLVAWELAARGWSVLLLNPRGSIGRGEAYFHGVDEGWGERDRDDFLCAIDALVEEGIVDPARVGVTGYSYGGFMTNYLITHTDRFAAAVVGAGHSDFTQLYATSAVANLIEAELGGPPAARRELYERLSPLRRVEHVRTPVLFLHGMADQINPCAGSEAMFTQLRKLGRTAELVLYPGGSHESGTWPHSLRVDFERRLVAWMERHV